MFNKSAYVHTTYFKRLCDAVDDIHKRTSGETPFGSGISSINPNDLYRKVALALQESNILLNYGTKYDPNYVWGDTPLTESVYHRVYKWIREYNKTYYSKPTQKPMEEKTIQPETSIVEEAPKADVICEKKAVSLEDYLDQQLWDELKHRGYTISEGKLQKITYLN